MKKVSVVIIIVIILGVVLPKFLIKDKAVSLSEGPHCPSMEVYQFLDNPFERILLLLGGLQTISKTGMPIGYSDTATGESNYVVRAYTIFGIPFATVEVEECYGAVRRL
jgi:hypothetical protein